MKTDLDYILDTDFSALKKEKIHSLNDFSSLHPDLLHDPRLFSIESSKSGEYMLLGMEFFEIKTYGCFSGSLHFDSPRFPIYKSEDDLTYYTSNYSCKFTRLREIYDSLLSVREDLLPSLWIVSEYFHEVIDSWESIYQRVTSSEFQGEDNDLFTDMVNHFHYIDNTPENFENLLKSMLL